MDARVLTDRIMANGSEGRPEFSVVAPVRNEADNVEGLAKEIAETLAGRAYEMIFVDDSSVDDTRARLHALKDKYPQLRIIGHRKNAGQSRAVRTGVLAARSPVIVTIDGDGQNDPADLIGLANQLTRADAPGNLALVQGRRDKRSDSGWKRFGSRVANAVRKSILKDKSPDSGCGARAFKREAYIQLPYFDHMHRYLIALMLREGYDVRFVPVSHRPRGAGRSKYGVWDRALVGVRDIMGVMWLIRRFRGPAEIKEL